MTYRRIRWQRAAASARRRRVERGIYQQPNGKYAVCVRVDGRARFRTLEATTLVEARIQRELLQSVAQIGELPLSPRLTFAEVAARWLAEFEAKVAAGERRERTLDLYRSQLYRHLLPRLGRRRPALITADDIVALTRELQADSLSPWTVKRILAAKQFRGTPAGIRRRLPNSSGKGRRCSPRSPASGHCYLIKNVTKT